MSLYSFKAEADVRRNYELLSSNRYEKKRDVDPENIKQRLPQRLLRRTLSSKSFFAYITDQTGVEISCFKLREG